jgi:Ca2+-binding RTX toxin-like protein
VAFPSSSGDDILSSGKGNDTLKGGGGADTNVVVRVDAVGAVSGANWWPRKPKATVSISGRDGRYGRRAGG